MVICYKLRSVLVSQGELHERDTFNMYISQCRRINNKTLTECAAFEGPMSDRHFA